VTKVNPKIGYTTVYRTLKLFTRLGLAAQRKFADGETQYEPIEGKNHHDHLICLECGKIIEFEDDALETLQNGIAQRYRFKISITGWSFTAVVPIADQKREFLKQKGEGWSPVPKRRSKPRSPSRESHSHRKSECGEIGYL